MYIATILDEISQPINFLTRIAMDFITSILSTGKYSWNNCSVEGNPRLLFDICF